MQDECRVVTLEVSVKRLLGGIELSTVEVNPRFDAIENELHMVINFRPGSDSVLDLSNVTVSLTLTGDSSGETGSMKSTSVPTHILIPDT